MVCPQIRMGEGPDPTPHPSFCVDPFELPSPARGEGTVTMTTRAAPDNVGYSAAAGAAEAAAPCMTPATVT
jgi:hypothetical protein